MTSLQDFANYDNQTPRISVVPDHGQSIGMRIIRFAEYAGLMLDPWQKSVIMGSHHVDDGKLFTKRVGLVVPRQNGKGSILEALGLYWLFVSTEPLILHSAHQFKTSADAYKRLSSLITGRPELEAKVSKFNNSHGSEGIEMKDGREYKFIARGGQGSGRGFPASKVVLDEAFDLTPKTLADVLPTTGAQKDSQIWYTSSPVNKEYHPNGHALSRIRHRAINRKNIDQLAYFEWSVPDDLSVLEYHKRDWWKISNPGYDYRPDMEGVLQADFDDMGIKEFGVEHLGKGDWFDPDDMGAVISVDQWNALLDSGSRIAGKRLFSLVVAPYARYASVGVVGFTAEGKYHVEVIKSGRGTAWVVDYLKERCERWKPMAVIYDPRSASAALEHALLDAKLPLEPIKGAQVSQAFSMFYDLCTEQKTVRHIEQPSINEALLGASARMVGESLVWDWKAAKSDITGLVAITNGLYMFSMKTSGYVDVAASCW